MKIQARHGAVCRGLGYALVQNDVMGWSQFCEIAALRMTQKELATAKPYAKWLESTQIHLNELDDPVTTAIFFTSSSALGSSTTSLVTVSKGTCAKA